MIAVLFAPAFLYAGQIYGRIVSDGKGLKAAKIEVQCGQATAVTGTTAADGAYRINVPQQGQCTLGLPEQAGHPTASIFSSPNPALYDFELVKASDGKMELKRK
ncbi:MAG: hypothetical protein AB7O65_12905 [Candidatus Korobacteraceae bacterium]